MYQQERMDAIMEILRQNHYVTVDYLVKQIRYSPASIRRDLTLLEKQGLVKRSYGGVSFCDANSSPFRFRQHSMKSAKNNMSKIAAGLVEDHDVVYIDGSSTTQYIGKHLLDKKDITVITSNMLLANFLSEQGITVYCPGGKVVEIPGILGGELMLKALSSFQINIAFFSSKSLSKDGKILAEFEMTMREFQILREHTQKLVYLCGSDKFDTYANFVGLTLDDVDYFISDAEPSKELTDRYANTSFMCTN